MFEFLDLVHLKRQVRRHIVLSQLLLNGFGSCGLLLLLVGWNIDFFLGPSDFFVDVFDFVQQFLKLLVPFYLFISFDAMFVWKWFKLRANKAFDNFLDVRDVFNLHFGHDKRHVQNIDHPRFFHSHGFSRRG